MVHARNEIERLREANILYLVVSKFCDVDLHPNTVPNEQMGLIFENLIRRFNELANETAGDHFTPREVIRLMVSILFIQDDKLLATPGTVRKLLDPACGAGLPRVNDGSLLFYKYTPPRPLEVIDAELKEAEEEIIRLLREVTT